MRDSKGRFVKGCKIPIEMIEKRADKIRGIKRPESIKRNSQKTMLNNWATGRMVGKFPKGKDHHWWKGGASSFCSVLENSLDYRNWRKEVFIRDNRTCQECGRRDKINAHHIKALSLIYQEFLTHYSQFSPIEDKETLIRIAATYKPFWDIANGVTLCENCHIKTDNFGAKQYWRTKNGTN